MIACRSLRVSATSVCREDTDTRRPSLSPLSLSLSVSLWLSLCLSLSLVIVIVVVVVIIAAVPAKRRDSRLAGPRRGSDSDPTRMARMAAGSDSDGSDGCGIRLGWRLGSPRPLPGRRVGGARWQSRPPVLQSPLVPASCRCCPAPRPPARASRRLGSDARETRIETRIRGWLSESAFWRLGSDAWREARVVVRH